jgi:hypothetical protein
LNTSTGAVTGTPIASGSYSFTIQATNSYGTITQAFSGKVAVGIKVYNGSAWVVGTVKVFNGTSWVSATPNIYKGTGWTP